MLKLKHIRYPLLQKGFNIDDINKIGSSGLFEKESYKQTFIVKLFIYTILSQTTSWSK